MAYTDRKLKSPSRRRSIVYSPSKKRFTDVRENALSLASKLRPSEALELFHFMAMPMPKAQRKNAIDTIILLKESTEEEVTSYLAYTSAHMKIGDAMLPAKNVPRHFSLYEIQEGSETFDIFTDDYELFSSFNPSTETQSLIRYGLV